MTNEPSVTSVPFVVGAVDPSLHDRYVPARPSVLSFQGFDSAGAGQELNIAQHARRQAARQAALAPRFFC